MLDPGDFLTISEKFGCPFKYFLEKRSEIIQVSLIFQHFSERYLSRYHLHVPFVHPLTSTRCYDPVTIDQDGLLSQLGGLTVTG